MKLIFLDIDGVLNTDYTKELTSSGTIFVEDNKIKILKQIIDETDAKVVLSSTWRMGWLGSEMEIQRSVFGQDFIELRNKLEEFGIVLYDKTPVFDNYMRLRGEEIKAYLDSHNNIDGYVIIDDLDGHYLRPCSSHLLQTSQLKGLQEKHIKAAKRIMKMEV